jgi:hypothetical protein
MGYLDNFDNRSLNKYKKIEKKTYKYILYLEIDGD